MIEGLQVVLEDGLERDRALLAVLFYPYMQTFPTLEAPTSMQIMKPHKLPPLPRMSTLPTANPHPSI